MAHQRHADFLQDAGFHQTRVKGVAEIVKTDVADSGILQGRLPGALYDADGAIVISNDEALGLALLYKQFEQTVG